MSNLILILDAGHGGIIDGQYTTAPKKMFKHSDGSIAYEGVINRQIKNKLIEMLKGREYYDVTPGNVDIPLKIRVNLANAFYTNNKHRGNIVYISIHSNAGGGSGFEVWTSPGQTLSDKYAEIWLQEIRKEFSNYKLRTDKSDGDQDKESKFYVLVNTVCPAVLGEYLFFDNYQDWQYQQTDEYIEKAARSICNFVVRAENEI